MRAVQDFADAVRASGRDGSCESGCEEEDRGGETEALRVHD